MKLKIVSDGTPQGTKVVNTETGEEIERVRFIRWTCRYDDTAKATVEVDCGGIEAVAEGTVRKDTALPTLLKCDACGARLFSLPPDHEYATCFNEICRNSRSRRKRPPPAPPPPPGPKPFDVREGSLPPSPPPPPARPGPVCSRNSEAGALFAPLCPKCDSDQKRRFWILGRVLGCIQPECENYHGRKK